MRLKNIDERKNYFTEKINKIIWWVRRTKKFLWLQILLSNHLFYCLPLLNIFQFGIPVCITSFVVGFKVCVIAVRIKKMKASNLKKQHKEAW